MRSPRIIKTLATVLILAGLAVQVRAETDQAGTTKQWGTVEITLKSYKAAGNQVGIWLLFRNNAARSESISSLMQFEATSNEGDRGELSWENTKCDGKIPPHGLLKCLLVYNFPTRPQSVTLMIGAGILAEEVIFELAISGTSSS
jgi:hypothetical protein